MSDWFCNSRNVEVNIIGSPMRSQERVSYLASPCLA